MKLRTFLFLSLVLLLTSCVNFKGTDTWVFAEGLWLLLVVAGLPAIWGIYATIKGYASGVYVKDSRSGKWLNGEGKMLPQWPLYVAIFCTILFIVILVIQNRQA